MSDTELKAQLARTEQALLEAEQEIDRQRRAAPPPPNQKFRRELRR
jgi:hypothetical protein